MAVKGSPLPSISIFDVDAKEEVATLSDGAELEYTAIAMSRCVRKRPRRAHAALPDAGAYDATVAGYIYWLQLLRVWWSWALRWCGMGRRRCDVTTAASGCWLLLLLSQGRFACRRLR